MRYTIIYPRQELKDFVSHFWFTTKDVDREEKNSTHYSTACSLANLIFAYKENESCPLQTFSYFQGPTHIPREIPKSDDGFGKIFGVSIYSYAIPQFFNVLASELSTRSVPLSTLWGSQDKLLLDMMGSSLPPEKCIHILSDYLESQLISKDCKDEIIVKATNQIRQKNGNINVEKLSRELSLSQKQFTRRFKIHTGFNPKLYARVVRFESAFYNLAEYSSLTEAACMNGYFDQAHFIQDFKAFTGHSPNKFIAVADL